MDLAGTTLKVWGSLRARKEAKRRAAAEAAALRKQAGARRSEGQYAAEEEQRVARQVYSRALALAAASGGGVSNITVDKILGDIDAEGDYRALTRRYSAEYEAQGLETAADESISVGKAEAFQHGLRAAVTVFDDGGDLWKKYS